MSIKIEKSDLTKMTEVMADMENEFQQWRPHFQEIAKYLLPRRYVWLAERSPLSSGVSSTSIRAAQSKNNNILDSTGTKALRDQAAGLLNGITSPARPWLRLRVAGFAYDEQDREAKLWTDECARRMLLVLAGSNFYSSMAIHYLDLSCFGTAAMLVYEDFEDVVRFYPSPMGEYRLAQNHRRATDRFGRTFVMTVRQVVQMFGIENVSKNVKLAYNAGGTRTGEGVVVCHLIEPNEENGSLYIKGGYEYREMYWEHGCGTGELLAHNVFNEKPGAWPRWEVTANDVYGTSNTMDAIPDIIQLQHEVLRKAQALDYLVRPPVIQEGFMANTPGSLLPGARTVVPPSASFGAKAIYTVNPPLGEIEQGIRALQERIKVMFNNDLFRMISSLDTVRTATEIDARKEEKLVLLGAVLQRFENEALNPVLRRVFNIMQRKNLLPEAPPELDGREVEIEYISILSEAQRAIGTSVIERFLQIVGNMASIAPDTLQSVDMDEVLRDYAERLNVSVGYFRPREELEAAREQNAELTQAREQALVGKDLSQAASNLSDTDLGGGENAIQRLLGG